MAGTKIKFTHEKSKSRKGQERVRGVGRPKRERPPAAGRPGSSRRPGPRGQRRGAEEGGLLRSPRGGGRGALRAVGGSDGRGTSADEQRRESELSLPAPEPRLS
ncbi:Hypothetical predicted protein [Marmota monax]|uniref:Uncharacterized protein n=1 Tax=Marmota monax TaxID=9995 RepID=A0A5E4CNX5_MARMO|nr:Hypothetical predicted protein [Marmota monax]